MKNPNTFFITVALISAGILILGATLVTKTSAPELQDSENTNLEVLGEKTHSWNDIDINGGNVEHTFNIKNSGEGMLEITNFQTSCMCTEVQIDIKGEESPVFGMHSQSSWKGEIEPGESASIRVVFDPLFHGPQGVGPITRLVSFNTNDPNNKSVELQLTGNVIKK